MSANVLLNLFNTIHYIASCMAKCDVKCCIGKTSNRTIAHLIVYCVCQTYNTCTVVPTKSDSDVIFCLQFLSKTLNCTLHLR